MRKSWDSEWNTACCYLPANRYHFELLREHIVYDSMATRVRFGDEHYSPNILAWTEESCLGARLDHKHSIPYNLHKLHAF